ncbi:SapC family protein [Luteimonas suaedae]|uniref:SapC family protein n=1 Tax=Luteimonas suaedae TaxID=2605430 RepID=UPI0011EDDA85|nr:SapC family protein [Luteimonas suaedae]
MTRHVPLNVVDHRNLRVDPARGDALGDAVMFAPTFPAEFRNVQAHYPIVFHRQRDGGLQPLALFGLQRGHNLFLDGDHWDAAYLPLAMERQPFLIGSADDEPTVHIDLDSPRVGTTTGEPLFLEHGGNAPLLERVRSVLKTLHAGLQATPAFCTALERHDLLEPFVLDAQLHDGTTHRLSGFHVIHEERLRALPEDVVAGLHRGGHLEAAYMAIASMSRFRDLIDRSNRRRNASAH